MFPGLAPSLSTLANHRLNDSSPAIVGARTCRATPPAPSLFGNPQQPPEFLIRPAPRVPLSPGEPGAGAVEDQGGGPARVRRREQAGQDTALAQAEKRGAPAARGIEHRQNVVNLFLQRWKVNRPVRKPCPSHVQDDQPRERGEPTQEPGERRLLKLELNVAEATLKQDQIDRPAAHDPVGDVGATASPVAGLGRFHQHLTAMTPSPDGRACAGMPSVDQPSTT